MIEEQVEMLIQAIERANLEDGKNWSVKQMVSKNSSWKRKSKI